MRRRRAPSRPRPEFWSIGWALHVICLRVGRAQPRLAELDIEIVILPLLSLSGTIALPGTATRSADNPIGAMLVDVRVRVRFAWNVRTWCVAGTHAARESCLHIRLDDDLHAHRACSPSVRRRGGDGSLRTSIDVGRRS